MRPPHALPARAERELTPLLEQAHSKEEYRCVLCVWLRAALRRPAAALATALGWSTGSVHNWHAQYRREGASTLLGVGRGGRHRALLTIEEEKPWLAACALLAEPGDVTELSTVQTAREPRVGPVVAPSTV